MKNFVKKFDLKFQYVFFTSNPSRNTFGRQRNKSKPWLINGPSSSSFTPIPQAGSNAIHALCHVCSSHLQATDWGWGMYTLCGPRETFLRKQTLTHWTIRRSSLSLKIGLQDMESKAISQRVRSNGDDRSTSRHSVHQETLPSSSSETSPCFPRLICGRKLKP